jgi:hypothetical protein
MFRGTLKALFYCHFVKKDFFCNLNRSVTASPPFGGSGYEKTQSGLRPFVRFFSATIFCARKNAARFSSSGAKKRQLQPERYVQWGLFFWGNIMG